MVAAMLASGRVANLASRTMPSFLGLGTLPMRLLVPIAVVALLFPYAAGAATLDRVDDTAPATPAAAAVIQFGGVLGTVYSPSSVTIGAGDTVEWQGDFGSHPLVSDDALWPTNNTGTVFDFTFTTLGTHLVHCQIHGGPNGVGMAGRVNVIAPAVDLGQGVGRPGGVACLPATLSSGGVQVAGTSNDLGFDATAFAVNGCTINPAIGPGSAADKQLSHGAVGPGVERVGVSGSTPTLIPDGLLYACQFGIGIGVNPGAYAVANSPRALDAGNDLPGVKGSTGQIVVTTCSGDCNGNGVVTIGEVLKCVNLFLGQPLCNMTNANLSCPVADANGNGSVSIGEVIQCVNRFLNGC